MPPGIIAILSGARPAQLVSLEAAAAITGRFFDRTLYSIGIVWAARLRHGLGSASSLPSLALGLLGSSRSRQQQLSRFASSTARSTDIVGAALLRHCLRSRSSASSLSSLALGLLCAALLRHGLSTAVLLGIVATLVGARFARLVSLEAAAASTGRFVDRCCLAGSHALQQQRRQRRRQQHQSNQAFLTVSDTVSATVDAQGLIASAVPGSTRLHAALVTFLRSWQPS